MVSIVLWLQRAPKTLEASEHGDTPDASSMGGPFMLPESLITLVIALHIVLHVRDETTFAVVFEQSSDVLVVTGRITILGKGAITIVGPQTVNCPRVRRA